MLSHIRFLFLSIVYCSNSGTTVCKFQINVMCLLILFILACHIILCGDPVDVVDNDLLLGNCIYKNTYTQSSKSMISNFYRRSNQVKISFRMINGIKLNRFAFDFL